MEHLKDGIGQMRGMLDRLIPADRECLLLDFPDYANVGDSAIWLGQVHLLRKLGRRIAAIGDISRYSIETVLRDAGERVVLLSGGGNLGDVWEAHQVFRERVVAMLPRNRVVQLPQSIHFADREREDRATAIFRQHPDFHLFARDPASLEIARRISGDRAVMVPDMACCLPRNVRGDASAARWDVVVVRRTDKESRCGPSAPLDVPGEKVLVTDWTSEDRGFAHSLYARLQGIDSSRRPRLKPTLDRLVRASANRLARYRFERGMALLESGRAVVTDRLHAVILSWLRGVPVYYSDNAYGKIASFASEWLKDDPDVTQVPDLSDGIARALEASASSRSI
ncbi:MAG: polysaccharide pyruvyl transferase family protein [Betaproteobacteria bacterium]|nr:polysaccharide pyruvyl transferase family protein [Betaproteobacteria bacterium]